MRYAWRGFDVTQISPAMAECVLIVDDEPDIRELIGEILDDEGYRTVLAGDATAARIARAEHHPDLILLDVWMPDCDGVTLLKEWHDQNQLNCPVVMISGHGSVEAAVEATRHGAFDFIEKPVSMARLLATIKRALASTRRASDTVGQSAEEAEVPDPVGRSPAMEALRGKLDQIIDSRANVLLCGEAGSGCTSLARWIHAHSASPAGRFTQIACNHDGSAIHERLGTGLDGLAPGTIYLDRLHRLGPSGVETLADLLARIENMPAGSLRIVASATPGASIADPALRAKLAQVRIDVPALRERPEDIPDLVRAMAERIPATEGLNYRPVPVPVQNRLRQHDWPGNLAELAGLLRQLLLEETDDPVRIDEVEGLLAQPAVGADPDAPMAHSPLFNLPLREAREAFERQYLMTRLRQAGGSVGQLADAVEMERTHLYRKLKQLGIDPKRIQEDA